MAITMNQKTVSIIGIVALIAILLFGNLIGYKLGFRGGFLNVAGNIILAVFLIWLGYKIYKINK